MRKILLISYIVLIFAFAAPALLMWGKDPAAERAEPAPARTSPRPIRLITEDGLREPDMEDYLVGVVAAEMPAAFPPEALKAQAVAARTYTLYCAAAKRHGDAQVCDNSGCCQAWMDEGELKERWGGDYERYRAIIKAAVDETAGEYLSYGGEPVCAAFHSSSAGLTEASASIWSPTPYLISVPSPETAETVPGLISRLELSPQEFALALLESCPAADFSAAPEYWLGEISLNSTGRVRGAVIGGQELSGGTLRGIFALRSTDFELEYTGTGFLFTVYGYGHGVGMSQYGAKLLAEAGQEYKAILAHYYPGTELVKSE